MSPRPKLRLALPALLALVGPACAAEEEASAPPPPVDPDRVVLEADQIEALRLRWEAVAVDTLRPLREVPGVLAPPDTAMAAVGSVVEGRVARVRIVAGDRVRAGDPLVELHTHELTDARGELARAEAERSYAQAALDRGADLFDAGAISREELERRERDAAAAEGGVARWAEVVEHLHPVAYDLAAAIAPFDGVVHEVQVSPGEAVVPGTPLVRVGATDALWVTARVPEDAAADLADGVEVEVISGSESFVARVVRAGARVDPETRAIEVRLALLEPSTTLRPGSWVTALIPIGEGTAATALPEAAVVRSDIGDAVYVREGEGVFRRLAVQASPLRAGHLRVTGVPAGAEVVVVGAYRLEAARITATGEGEGG